MFEGEGNAVADSGTTDTGSVQTESQAGDYNLLSDTGETEAAPVRYFNGKYERLDAYDLAHKAAEDKIRSGSLKTLEGVTDEVLREHATTRGMIDSVPEAYEGYLERFEQAGFDAFPEDHETHATFRKELADNKISQSQFNWMMGKLKEVTAANSMVWGAIDSQKESTTLLQTWGKDAPAIKKAIGQFAQKNLPPEEYLVPRMATAKGLISLKAQMDAHNAAAGGPMVDVDRPGSEDEALSVRAAIKSILDNPAYSNASDPTHNLLQQKMDKLSERQSKLLKSVR